jgi:hypothetical protein
MSTSFAPKGLHELALPIPGFAEITVDTLGPPTVYTMPIHHKGVKGCGIHK